MGTSIAEPLSKCGPKKAATRSKIHPRRQEKPASVKLSPMSTCPGGLALRGPDALCSGPFLGGGYPTFLVF